jgi:putative SOS response-associated peptidase YedK
VWTFFAINDPRAVPGFLADEAEQDIPYDPEPIGRYNVAPGTKVLLLSERDEQLHLDPVFWGYAPGWWDKPPLINARVETAATSRMFKPLWQHGRAICFADGWFEWKKEGDKSSHISSTAPTANQYLWRRSAVHHSNAVTKLKGF